MVQLGGHPRHVPGRRDRPGGREPTGDIARVLSGYHAALGARVFDHRVLEELAAASSIPVVNLLSDTGHPCQSLADLLTMRQAWGALAGRTVAWIGDFNNVARSLALGAALSGMRLRIASPSGYGPSDADIDRLLEAGLGGRPVVTDRPLEAAEGADAVHTDIWASMGQEDEADGAPPGLRGLPGRRPGDGGGRRPRRCSCTAFPPTAARRWRPASSTARRATCSRRPTTGCTRSAASCASSWRTPAMSHASPSDSTGSPSCSPSSAVTSQAHLVELLAAEGVAATQATVSRDLEDLGAIKVRGAGGETVYAIPELPTEQRAPEDHLRRVFGDWVVEVNHSGNLVVLRTPPGSAHVVGSALDRSGLPGVLGTVAGDDTLIVVTSEEAGGAAMARQLSDLAGLH